MESQLAEIVPGMRFRGRKVYLEQKGLNKDEVDADEPKIKKDCVDFAFAIKRAIEKVQGSQGGLIIDPRRCMN